MQTPTTGRATGVELTIGGMTCASCAARIEKKLNTLDGVSATVNFEHIRKHYYTSHKAINPTGIVPIGPEVDFSAGVSKGSDIVSRRNFKLSGSVKESFMPRLPSRKTEDRIDTRLRGPAFLFDLDGTLVDSVYQHVLAWREALQASGFELTVWRIHRRIGMSGGLLSNALLRETGHRVSAEEADHLQRLHTEAYARQVSQVRPLPGARELLAYLSEAGVLFAIATSGRQESARLTLDVLGLTFAVPVITRDQVDHAKPDPDLFLAAADRLGVDISESVVVGDSVWDLLAAQRARTLGVGLLSGGYGRDELERAGAYRVYQDPADLLNHLDEVGVRP